MLDDGGGGGKGNPPPSPSPIQSVHDHLAAIRRDVRILLVLALLILAALLLRN